MFVSCLRLLVFCILLRDVAPLVSGNVMLHVPNFLLVTLPAMLLPSASATALSRASAVPLASVAIAGAVEILLASEGGSDHLVDDLHQLAITCHVRRF